MKTTIKSPLTGLVLAESDDPQSAPSVPTGFVPRVNPPGVKVALDMIKKACSPLDHQEGGDHYKGMQIQPVSFIHANGIGFLEGNAIKYLCRWRAKGGVEDIKKARHYLDLLIEMEGSK